MATQPLTLKVMRLSRPQLSRSTQYPIDIDPNNSIGASLSSTLTELTVSQPLDSGTPNSTTQLPSALQPLSEFPVTETLRLPQSFGTMYLGESFTAHLCISNESTLTVRDISVRIIMQTASQQFALHASSETVNLAVKQATNIQVGHEIKELGTHVLGCTISYLSAQGERRAMQKSFKFQVANPLVVKTKVNHLRRNVLLEVQVQNATANTIALERLNFDASDPFTLDDLNVLPKSASARDSGESSSSIWGGSVFLRPADVRQYLYRLSLRSPEEEKSVEDERALQYTTGLGKLDILWRGAFGSVGRLQTSQLTRKSPGVFLIDVDKSWIVGQERSEASVEVPFSLRVRLRNLSENKMRLVATVDPHRYPSVVPCGKMQIVAGDADVGGTVEFDILFVPLAVGVQRMGAIKVVDEISGYARDVDYLADVYVGS